MKAPFPWFGGKSRVADSVWRSFGPVDLYAEPFFGTGAVLLANPYPLPAREVVCDLDGMVCNFWRAVRADPDTVAWHADYPTFHQDLTARHGALVEWRERNRDRLSEDPDYHDAKMAGWWVWGCSLWIGSGWCAVGNDQIPHVSAWGPGVAQGVARRGPPDSMPKVAAKCPSHGQGVSRQTKALHDKRPWVLDRSLHGRGVQRQGPPGGDACDGSRLVPTMRALAARMANVIVLNRDWRSALSDTVLARTASSRKGIRRAVFLDPPYRMGSGRKAGLYATEDGDAADGAYRWALENGDGMPVVYCCAEGDYEWPGGWRALRKPYKGRRDATGVTHETIMCSPACML